MFTQSKKVLITCCCISVLLLSSCAGRGGMSHGRIGGGGGANPLTGLIIGGIIGGVIGHEIGKGETRANATIVGATVGTFIGGNVGHHMNHSDRVYVTHSLETVRTGVATQWYNPDTGYEYRVVPTHTYSLHEQPCREYTVEATIEGDTEQVYGVACRQPDGSWAVRK